MSEQSYIDHIAKIIVPSGQELQQDFWDRKWAAIEELNTLDAILKERLFFFEKERSRENALSLILFADLCWQVLRKLGDKSGDDSEWLTLGFGDKLSKTLQQVSKEIVHVFKLHSLLRHPEKLLPAYNWMLDDPWPDDQAKELIKAARHIKSIISILSSLNTSDGFEGDVEEKHKLLRNAKSKAAKTVAP